MYNSSWYMDVVFDSPSACNLRVCSPPLFNSLVVSMCAAWSQAVTLQKIGAVQVISQAQWVHTPASDE